MKPISAVILGAPGLGKSTLAGSVMELEQVKKAKLLVTKPGEEKSWLYQKYGLTDEAELFYDLGWNPTLGELKAGAYLKLLKRLRELQADTDFDAVIIDPGTDAINLLEHHILESQGVGSPGELRDTQGFYRQLRDKAQEFVLYAHLLSTPLVKRPKFVLIPWHTQPPKDGNIVSLGHGMKEKQESADQKAAGIEYEGQVLPMVEGSYRRKLAADVDVVVYCDLVSNKQINKKTKKPEEVTEYMIQVVPNKDRHSKIRIAPTLEGQMIPNRMPDLWRAIEDVSNQP